MKTVWLMWAPDGLETWPMIFSSLAKAQKEAEKEIELEFENGERSLIVDLKWSWNDSVLGGECWQYGDFPIGYRLRHICEEEVL